MSVSFISIMVMVYKCGYTCTYTDLNKYRLYLYVKEMCDKVKNDFEGVFNDKRKKKLPAI